MKSSSPFFGEILHFLLAFFLLNAPFRRRNNEEFKFTGKTIWTKITVFYYCEIAITLITIVSLPLI